MTIKEYVLQHRNLTAEETVKSAKRDGFKTTLGYVKFVRHANGISNRVPALKSTPAPAPVKKVAKATVKHDEPVVVVNTTSDASPLELHIRSVARAEIETAIAMFVAKLSS